MTRVLITGGALSNNNGAVAMTLGAIKYVRNRIPSCEITVLTPYYNNDFNRYNNLNIRVIGYDLYLSTFLRYFLRVVPWYFFNRFSFNFDKLIDNSVLQEYYSADVILDVSGDSYSDDYGTPVSLQCSFKILIGLLFGKKVVILPQSIGPFKNILTKSLAKRILKKVHIIYAREEITKTYLLSLGIKDNLRFCPDLAFLTDVVADSDALRLIRKYGSLNTPTVIGISVSQSITRYSNMTSKKTRSYYVTMMALMSDYLISKYNATIIFVPQVIGPGNTNDDRIISNEVIGIIKKKERCIHIDADLKPSELSGIIRQCDAFIGARMHANINALINAVPLVAISYSHKTKGIMTLMNQEPYVCEFKSMNIDGLKYMVDDLMNNRSKIHLQIKSRLKHVLKLIDNPTV